MTVAVGAIAEKILFSVSKDGQSSASDEKQGGHRATGVVLSNKASVTKYAVAARKEVILTAGVVGTPHLLLLSGVGPREEIEPHEIPMVLELPAVGRNLSDVSSHLRFPPCTLCLLTSYVLLSIWPPVH